MRAAPAVTLLLAIAATVAHAQRPLTPDQSGMIEAARVVALSYTRSLPDFVCTETVRREQDVSGRGRWRSVDTLKVAVSYAAHKEDYKLIERNGLPTVQDFEFVGGAISTGEFGSRMADVFSRATKAQFEWKGWAHVRGRRTAVFRYRVDRENSHHSVRYGTVENPVTLIVAFHGELSIDPETKAALRITQICDGLPHSGVTAASSSVEYDYRDVAGRSYLLPVSSVTNIGDRGFQARNQMSFDNYRKFQSDATITFKP
jgi:hypothetical protein